MIDCMIVGDSIGVGTAIYMAVNSLLHGYQDYKIVVNGVEK